MCANKWRQQCQSLIGQRITVSDRNGRTYHGVLQGVRNEGIVLNPMRGMGTVADSKSNPSARDVHHAMGSSVDSSDIEEAFWPAWFLIAWALIAGLWVLSGPRFYGRGPYGGYGPGYPGPYGYGPPYRRGFVW